MSPFPGAGHTIHLVCDKKNLPEFPDLLFGTHVDGSTYIDATNYLQSIESDQRNLTVADFFSKFDVFIQAIKEEYEISDQQLVTLNHQGHQLINDKLCYLLVGYANRDFLSYMNDRINDLFVEGVVVSDASIITLARRRLPTEIIKKIWEHETGGQANTDIQ